MAKCAYCDKKIKEIEEKWIDENVKDEEEKEKKKAYLSNILKDIGSKANCENEAIDGGEFCKFHDPEYWKSHEDEVRNEFLKLLQSSGDKYFVGFHLPAIKLPKVVEGDLHMELAKIHGVFDAPTKFQGSVWFNEATFQEARFSGATFQEASFFRAEFQKASFFRAKFQEASFDHATFQEASFDGAEFQEASFFRAKFQKASFFRAKFQKASFFRAKFQEASFSYATFQGLASFNGAEFQEAWFSDATFQEARFSGATFQKASFNGAEFQEARFSDATFQEASFNGAKFQKASFDHATFQELASFDGAEFQEASFDHATFQEAWFNRAKFQEASFDHATFQGLASFNGAEFQEAWFSDATFQEARFSGATFQEARFNRAKFQGSALFNKATFREASFDGARFIGRTTFDDSVVSGSLLFRDSTFLPNFLYKCLDPRNYVSFRRINFKERIDFKGERFKDQGEIVFDGCNMKMVSFIHTDISRVKFRNVDWGEDFRIYDERLLLLKEGEKKEEDSFIKECGKKLKRIRDYYLSGEKKDEEIEKEINLDPRISEVLEEIKKLREKEELKKELSEKLNELKKELIQKIDDGIKYLEDKKNLEKLKEGLIKDGDLKLDNVLAVYRSLRDNYDYYLKYEDSGRFFVNEMRLRRRFIGRLSGGGIRKKLSNAVEKFVMLSYEALSLYGESYTRPMCFLIACITLFPLLRFLANCWPTPFQPCWSSLTPLLEELKKSTYAFFQLYWDENPLTLIERIISPIILTNLYISLRRKLERKIRH